MYLFTIIVFKLSEEKLIGRGRRVGGYVFKGTSESILIVPTFDILIEIFYYCFNTFSYDFFE